ncbi:uncharacterized protein LOC142164052 [Nicotiana tabacum]|uniref:Uncharacterized protein LOC142164052 n=1 Tax=Nicotiana tabacum TaxID=4097 RepID=A0AC58RX92_TOBAC
MYNNKNINNTGNYKPKRSQVQCEYCHYKGHTKENCYKLVGYPPDFKSKRKGINTGQYANQVCGAEMNFTDRYIMGNNVASSVTQQGRGGSHSNSGVPQPANQPTFFQKMPHPAPDLFSGQVKGIGREEHGLYILRGSTSMSVPSQKTNKCVNTADDTPISTSSISSTSSSSSVSVSSICSLWHKRLGHAPIDIIKKIEALSKWTTGNFHQPCTSEAIIVLRDFLTQANNMFSTTVKILRTDNGSEFFSIEFKHLLSSLDIVHQSTCVYTPQQNGVAERKQRTILEIARSFRFQAVVPLRFWGERVAIAVYLLNRLPSKVSGYKSPFEKLYLHPLSLSHLKVFGCLCYATTPKMLDKFSPRAVPAVLLGYSSTQKGYILYSLHSKTFMVNRNIVFHETVFPFKHVKNSGTLVFPILDLLSPELNAATPIFPLTPTVEDSTEPIEAQISSESPAEIPPFTTDTTASEPIIPAKNN